MSAWLPKVVEPSKQQGLAAVFFLILYPYYLIRVIYSRRRMGKISFAHSTYIHPSQARNRLASKGRKITSKSRPPLVGGSTRYLLIVSLLA